MAREYPSPFHGVRTPSCACVTATRRCGPERPTLGPVQGFDELDFDELGRELSEIAVGAAILGLRQVNILRRRLVEEVPAAAPFVEAFLEHLEQIAEPASLALGTVVATMGDAIAGDAGQRLREAGALLADAGPELLRLSGLTLRG